MQRQIESYLLNWKEKKNRKPLILRGARQVGKTYIIEQFGKQFFNLVKIDLEQRADARNILKSKEPKTIILELSALLNTSIVPGKTLLFIDEIQTSPEAIIALRYFYEQLPELHVIAAGSLLDHTLNEIPYSMPVGRIEFAYLHPLNFNEFLIASKEEQLIKYIANFKLETNFSESIHLRILSLLRIYFFVGGMPEAVKTYLETENMKAVEQVHNSILTALKYDFAKYGSRKQQEHLVDCLTYAGNHIGQKVKYTKINRNVRAAELKIALNKLTLSRIIHPVIRTKSSNVPINQHLDKNTYKIIFLDIGLMCYMANLKLTDINELAIEFAGSLTEQFVGQELLAAAEFYEDEQLYYYHREGKNANAEVDFLYQIGNHIFPIEVKAGKSGKLKSLQLYLAEKNKNLGIRLNTNLPNIGTNLKATVLYKNKKDTLSYTLLSLPIYFTSQLKSHNISSLLQNHLTQ